MEFIKSRYKAGDQNPDLLFDPLASASTPRGAAVPRGEGVFELALDAGPAGEEAREQNREDKRAYHTDDGEHDIFGTV